MDKPMDRVSASTKSQGRRKVRMGIVVSDKMDKTVVVTIERRFKHPLYKKYITKTKKMSAHDPKNEARTGDRVELMETRPLSKTKRWRVLRVVQRPQIRK